MRMLLQNITVVPMTGPSKSIEKGYVLINGNLIEAVGSGEPPAGEYEKVIDGTNYLVMPGFINTHTHAAMTMLRSYADDLPLMEWLETKIWPLEDRLTGDDIYWGTMLAIIEMIKSGTTTFTDMYFHMDRVAQAVEETGMRAVLSRGMIGVGPESQLALEQSRQLIEQWQGGAGGRITFMLGPHAPYTCPPDYLKQVVDLARETGTGIHIHVAETLDEINTINRDYGMSPVAYLEKAGIFEVPVIAAHCVHLSDEDIAILKKYGVGVAHNPESNMKLASGIARVPRMLAEGIAVGLGTDGASSNNDLDMLQETRTCALLHKVNSMDPTVLPAEQALSMATAIGAKALHMEDQIGCLRPGYKADLILINLNQPHMIPRYDLIANLVYAGKAGDVDTVIIDGRIVMENRQLTTIDEKQVLEKCKEIAERLVHAMD
ncbi:MAG TPA: amidohydrolase [Syntrophomonadaceae bacterium]|nr:amidohydrolase [Syntrophomonadaceae bacterium]